LEKELQLGRVQRFAAGAKDPPHQSVDLLPQEGVLLFELQQGLLALGQQAAEFLFALGHNDGAQDTGKPMTLSTKW
jgi:hypothetical protein